LSNRLFSQLERTSETLSLSLSLYSCSNAKATHKAKTSVPLRCTLSEDGGREGAREGREANKEKNPKV
jgi:hypothetical protein